ncbi:uncharacterized protein LOC126978728 [Leptidea sinapis]|uniref:uncharacterized protein LOC126978728 n=1 Tax=Leptidea sinapis TaxID=189913 RepID=UPI0021C2B60A|nr:uncharacterized protein LOC126978728 [Leptidea sinapis]
MWMIMFVLCQIAGAAAAGHGLLLLHRPQDISSQCAFAKHLRYDISFGMGMSDTITLVFRSIMEVDYGCVVEIVANTVSEYLLVVVRYPTLVGTNCEINKDAFTLLKKWRCIRLCDVVYDYSLDSHYFTFYVKERLRFKFLSNSSINADLNGLFYQVTVTTARKKPYIGCNRKNETICVIGESEFCFTSGVVCDGIKNCGVDDWFDERKTQCSLPVESLGYAPVVAVVAAALCALLALGHIIHRCLPPLADSFFIFNVNEDNRLCIDPMLVPVVDPLLKISAVERISVIPLFSSSSSDTEGEERSEAQPDAPETSEEQNIKTVVTKIEHVDQPTRKSTLKSISDRLQDTLWAFGSRKKSHDKEPPDII